MRQDRGERWGNPPFAPRDARQGSKASQTAQPPAHPSRAHLGHAGTRWMLTAGPGHPMPLVVGRTHAFALLMRVFTPSTAQKKLFLLLFVGCFFFFFARPLLRLLERCSAAPTPATDGATRSFGSNQFGTERNRLDLSAFGRTNNREPNLA